MRQQFAGDAGIFRGNEAGSPENTQGARTEVFQITDGGGDEIEGAHAPIKPQMGREGMREKRFFGVPRDRSAQTTRNNSKGQGKK